MHRVLCFLWMFWNSGVFLFPFLEKQNLTSIFYTLKLRFYWDFVNYAWKQEFSIQFNVLIGWNYVLWGYFKSSTSPKLLWSHDSIHYFPTWSLGAAILHIAVLVFQERVFFCSHFHKYSRDNLVFCKVISCSCN